MLFQDILLALTAMAAWGVNFSVVKLALVDFPPILLTALRFALVALVLIPFRPRPPPLIPLLGLAVSLGVLHFPLIFIALRWLDASTAAIVLQLQVPFAGIMAAIFLGDRLGWREITGTMVAFAGVALIAGAPRLGANHLGLALLICASIAFAVGTIQMKRLGPVDPFTLNGWLGLFIAIELFAIDHWVDGPATPIIAAAGWRGWVGVLYTSLISTIVGYGLWIYILKRHPVSRTMPFLLTIPVFAITAGIVVNGDRLTLDMVAGGLLTIGGIGLIVLRRADVAEAA